MAGVYTTGTIMNCIKIIDIFNDANNKKEIKEKVDYREFYNDGINQDVNLKEHIIIWIREKEQSKKYKTKIDKDKVFSLCFYPWILNAASKQELLRIDNKFN